MTKEELIKRINDLEWEDFDKALLLNVKLKG